MKAELSTILYIIIGLLALFGSGIEKYLKAKKAQQQPPVIPHSNEEFEDIPDETDESPRQSTFEELVRQLTQKAEMPEPEPELEPEFELEPTKVEYQSLEIIPTEPEYLVSTNIDLPEFLYADTTEKAAKTPATSCSFDIRAAVIASEILNRKYQ